MILAACPAFRKSALRRASTVQTFKSAFRRLGMREISCAGIGWNLGQNRQIHDALSLGGNVAVIRRSLTLDLKHRRNRIGEIVKIKTFETFGSSPVQSVRRLGRVEVLCSGRYIPRHCFRYLLL